MGKYLARIKIIFTIIQFTIGLMLRDKKSLLILLVMPFILIAVLGASLAGLMNGFTFEKAKIAVVDEDKSLQSFMLVNMSLRNEIFKSAIEIEELTEEEAEKKFDEKNVDGILYIYKGYGNDFIYDEKDKLVLKMNPVKSVQTELMKEALKISTIIGRMIVDGANDGVLDVVNDSKAVWRLVGNFLGNQSLVLEVKPGNDVHKKIDSFQYYSVGMGVMYTLFTMFTGVGFILNERKQHTLNRIKMMAFPTGLFYLGKSLAFMIISLLQLVILFAGSHYAFGVDFGEYLLYLLLVIFSYSLATGGLMILLMGWINSQNTLNVFFSMGVPVIAALGGSMIPVSAFPKFIEPVSVILPNRWAMEGLFAVMLDRPEESFQSVLFLIIFALITALIGIWQMEKRRSKTI